MHHSKLYFSKVQHVMMLVTLQSHHGSKVILRVTVILSLYALFRISFFQLTHLFYITVLLILFTVLSYPLHLRLAVLKPLALVNNMKRLLAEPSRLIISLSIKYHRQLKIDLYTGFCNISIVPFT